MPARPHTLHQGFWPLVEFEDREVFSALVRDWGELKPLLEGDACEPGGNSIDG